MKQTAQALENNLTSAGAHFLALADTTITPSLAHALNLSPNFVPTPRPSTRTQILAALPPFFRNLHLREIFAAGEQNLNTGTVFTPPYTPPAVKSAGQHDQLMADLAELANRRKIRLIRDPYPPPTKDPTTRTPETPALVAYRRDTTLEVKTIIAEQPLANSTTTNIDRHTLIAAKNVRKHGKIVVAVGDKNVGAVATTPEWYDTEVRRQLAAVESYSPIETKTAFEQVRKSLEQLKSIAKRHKLTAHERGFLVQYTHERAPNWQIPHFYLTIKLHKSPVVGRPIASWVNYALTPASKFLSAELQTLLRLEPSVLVNSAFMVHDIEQRSDSTALETTFLTADAGSCYTAMPRTAMKDSVGEFLDRHIALRNCRPERKPLLLDILEELLRCNFLEYKGTTWKQLTGIPMGTNAGPSTATVTLLIKVDLKLLKRFGNKIKMYRRWIDDLYVEVDSPETALEIKQWLLTCEPWLRFTVVIHTQHADFLDMRVFKPPGFAVERRLAVRVADKELSRHLYVPFSSFHPRHSFSGVVVGELIRAARLCTRPSDWLDFRDRLFGWLRARQYPTLFLAKWMARVKYSIRTRYTPDNQMHKQLHNTNTRTAVVFPYTPYTIRLRLQHAVQKHWEQYRSASGSAPLTAWKLATKLGAILNTSNR